MSIALPSRNEGLDIEHEDVNIIKRQRLFDGYRKVDHFSFTHTSMNPEAEKWLPEITREIVCGSNVAAVLLYEPEQDVLLMSKQFRLGALLSGYDDPFMIECVAGVVDEGEDIETTAHRETFEETGATIKEMEFIAKAMPSAGASTENVYLYCASIEEIPERRYYGLPEEGEEIETGVMTVEEIEKLLEEGVISNSMALISLNWFLRHHERLRNKWR